MDNTNMDDQKCLAGAARLELAITDINHEGQGIGHYQGLTVFVPGTIPGDVVNITITRRLSSYAVGKADNFLIKSKARIKPECPVAEECGGCTLQAMNYPQQLEYKQSMVHNALYRIGKVQNPEEKILPIKGMNNPWQYRAKVQMPVTGSHQEPRIGFYASRSHEVVDTDYCPVQPEVCDVIRQVIREYIRHWQVEPYDEATHSGLLRHIVIRIGFITEDIMVILVINGKTLPGLVELQQNLEEGIRNINDKTKHRYHLRSIYLCQNQKKTNLVLSDNLHLLAGSPQIEEEMIGIRYRISPLAFFQVNPLQAEVLFQTILDFADLKGRENVFDLYCGTGSITLQLARYAGKVIGIESNKEAIEDAKTNAQINRIENVEFITGKAEQLLPDQISQMAPDLIVIDPPRKGCDSKLITTLIEHKPVRIIYVSCNPATLARDVALLGEAGYVVEKVQPVDMFPWTGHVETVVLITRVKNREVEGASK